MRLKLRELQKVVNQTLMEERTVDALRKEVSRVLGPSIFTDVKLEALAESVNDRIDVLERTGRGSQVNFKPALLLKFADNQNAEVRRMVARVIPEQFLSKFRSDRDPAVRHAAARRLPLQVIKEMMKRTPNDDELRQIYREKMIVESGIPTPLVLDEPFDMYGKKLGDAVKQPAGPELSDQWYSMTAHKAISDYNHNIEGQWDEHWAHRFCASIKATSGVEVDGKKLWNEIQKQLKDRDDRTLERYSLKEVARRLRESFDDVQETVDPVESLASSNLSGSEFLREAARVFSIRESTMPRALHKYRFVEGKTFELKIPCTGKIPGRRNITSLDERVLDTYVKRWNDAQTQAGEPVRIDWAPNPNAMGSISFNVELK
jgi:hypothetical protein